VCTFVLFGLTPVELITVTVVVTRLLEVVCLAKLEEDRLLVDKMWDAGLVIFFLNLNV
jgi:hypothetical protein